jgi:hypothetical protein
VRLLDRLLELRVGRIGLVQELLHGVAQRFHRHALDAGGEPVEQPGARFVRVLHRALLGVGAHLVDAVGAQHQLSEFEQRVAVVEVAGLGLHRQQVLALGLVDLAEHAEGTPYR